MCFLNKPIFTILHSIDLHLVLSPRFLGYFIRDHRKRFLSEHALKFARFFKKQKTRFLRLFCLLSNFTTNIIEEHLKKANSGSEEHWTLFPGLMWFWLIHILYLHMTVECWHSFLVSNISVSPAWKITLNFYYPTPWVVLFFIYPTFYLLKTLCQGRRKLFLIEVAESDGRRPEEIF